MEKQWIAFFQQLKVYQQEHLHKLTRVPQHYHNDAEMGHWVHQQHLNQQQELLTKDQQQLLKLIEFYFELGPIQSSIQLCLEWNVSTTCCLSYPIWEYKIDKNLSQLTIDTMNRLSMDTLSQNTHDNSGGENQINPICRFWFWVVLRE